MPVGLQSSDKFPFYATTSTFNAIGKRGLKRKDGYEKVSGTGIYTRDVYLPGMLYAKTYLAPYAHAKIKSLDTSAVEAYPGVRAVFRYDDQWFTDVKWTASPRWTWGGQLEQILAQEVNWAGEPAGFAVCADTEQICDEAMKLAKFEWEILPFEIDPVKAIADNATILQPDVDPKTNVRYDGGTFSDGLEVHGDVEKGFAESDKVVEFSFSEQESTPAATEALSCVAVFRGDYLEAWVHNQVPMRSQRTLGNYFGNHIKVHVHCPYHGAQFGFEIWINYSKWYQLIPCIFAQRTKKPVKHVYDESYFHAGCYSHGTHNIKIGFNMDGTINAISDNSIRADAEINAKLWKGTSIKNTLGNTKIPYINRPAVVCFRHGVRSCGIWNQIFFRVSGETGLDPHIVAKKNDGAHGETMEEVTEKVKIPLGLSTVDALDTVFEAGKEAFGWDEKYHAPGAKILPNGRMHGVSMVHSIAWNPDPNTYFQSYQIGIFIQRMTPYVRILARHGTMAGTTRALSAGWLLMKSA
jgi:xanthine dehydrogenase molybdenum-binding subunit